MEMKIDKDKVVEAAKAYVEAAQEYTKQTGASHAVLKEYTALKEALSPPPPRPSKEECVRWLNRLVKSAKLNDMRDLDYRDAIATHLFEEPSFQWMKNTGLLPECEGLLVRFRTGQMSVLCNRYIICFNDKFAKENITDNCVADGDILEYIILE